MAYPRIEDHGIIGDMGTVALVAMNGTIDFLCAPSFDSPSVFAALLDERSGGAFQLEALLPDAVHRQLYLPETNVLLTRFLGDEAVAEISDFMPVTERGDRRIVRRTKVIRGTARFSMRCAPRFDYGRAGHTATQDTEGVTFVENAPGRGALKLMASVPMTLDSGDALADFTLRTGEVASFVLDLAPADRLPLPGDRYVAEVFKETANYWRAWVGKGTYRGRWREMVMRSALTLKLLTSREHGSLVAAPTFGLPEQLGGTRNWDYRYTWIRDASFTLYALMRLGYRSEAAAFIRWVEARCATQGQTSPLAILYRLDGTREVSEVALPHLHGYLGSRPVRIGNAAASHLQLDIYGELLDAIYLHDKFAEPISFQLWSDVTRLVDWVADNWKLADESIWEVRGGRREFLYSRVLCWVALDRALRIARRRSLPAPVMRWHDARDAVFMDVHSRFFDPEIGAFVQSPGTKTIDAAALLMPLVRFISPTDPRWVSTMRAVESRLVVDSLVYRYRLDRDFSDGLPPGEGTFSMCSFWYVECLSRMGDLEKARFYFEKMLGYANHLGLFGEELGPRGSHLGNFPQAFTHLALISAAYDLDRRLSEAGHPL